MLLPNIPSSLDAVLMDSSKFKNVFECGKAAVSKRRPHEIGLTHALSSPKRLKSNSARFDPCDHPTSALGSGYEPELANHQPPSKQYTDIRTSEYLAAPVPGGRSNLSSTLELDNQSPRTSASTSPSQNPPPLLSQTSFSTMTYSLYSAPQDEEIATNALTKKNVPFIPSKITTPHSTEALPCINEISLHDSSQGIRNSWLLKTESPPALSQTISSSVVENNEAAQPFFVKTSPIPSVPDQDFTTTLPATIATLEQDTQRKIFEIILVEQRGIHPLYRCGMLIDGPWSPVDVEDAMDPGVSIYENKDLSLLQVNRYFNKICSEIFYGQNVFFFYHADICRWWVQHIGLKNFSRIRSLTLGLGWGFIHGRCEDRSAFDLSQEEVWLSVLCWIQNRHRLDYFRIQIRGWNSLKCGRGLTDEELVQLTWCRQLIMSVLQRYRGIKEAELSCDGSRWLTPRETQSLALLMQQRREDVIKPKQLHLFELISSLRLVREEEEEEERRVRRQQYFDHRHGG